MLKVDSVALQAKVTHTLVDQSPAPASTTVNWNSGQEQRLGLEASITVTFTNPSPAAGVITGSIKIVKDTAGSWSITWPVAIKWVGNREPPTTGLALDEGRYAFFKWDGTEYVGSYTEVFS